MRRTLPPRPHIDHLKKQAKDLLDAHHRGELEALDRIRDALPAFAGRAPDEIARAAFALHDAQSAIAREYGFVSWRELRAHVLEGSAEPYSDKNLRAILDQYARVWPVAPPEELFTAMRNLRSAKRLADVTELLGAGVPALLPLIPVRNALMLRRMVAPFHVGRTLSLAALEAACRTTPSTLAVFAQRIESDETVTLAGLHRVGCQARVHASWPDGHGRQFVVLEALRPIALQAVEAATDGSAALFARVSAFALDERDLSGELPALSHSLRSSARQLAKTLPEPEPAIAALDQLDEADLADAVVANLPGSVADKASFAAEPSVVERVRIALRLVEAVAAAIPR